MMQRVEADAQILICGDGSNDAEHAIDAAAALFGPRRAVLLNMAPPMTFAEGMAATSSLVPGAFEDLNTAHALRRARRSVLHVVATHARRPVPIVPPPTHGTA